MRRLLSRTFIDPLRNWRRAVIYGSVFLGQTGFTLINSVSAYDYAGQIPTQGIAPLLTFALVFYIMLGPVVSPLVYAGFSLADGRRFRVALVLFEAAAFALYLWLPATPVLRGIAAALLSGPFWCAYNIGMIQNTTDDNMGFEVNLIGVFSLWGNIAALGLGGLALTLGHVEWSTAFALVAQLVATAGMLGASRIAARQNWADFKTELRDIARAKPFLMRRVAVQAAFHVPSQTMLATMHLANFPASLSSLLVTIRAIAGFVLAPLLGKLANRFSRSDFAWGLAFITGSCLLLMGARYAAIAFIAFLLLYSFGFTLTGNSIAVSWYRMRSYASMAWHEIMTGLGRAVGALLFLLLLPLGLDVYFCGIMLFCAAALGLDRWWAKQWSGEL